MLRQEGSNGDREMLSAFHAAGLEAWDVNMNDLLQGDTWLVLVLVLSLLVIYCFVLFTYMVRSFVCCCIGCFCVGV